MVLGWVGDLECYSAEEGGCWRDSEGGCRRDGIRDLRGKSAGYGVV